MYKVAMIFLAWFGAGPAFHPLCAIRSTDVMTFKDYGAKGDGSTLDTAAIQAAIDAAANAGGGIVHVDAGTYRTTTLMLKSHVTLDLDKDALLQASLDAADWSACNCQPVVGALSVTDIGLQGAGTIDGGGMTYYDAHNDGHVVSGNRPETLPLLSPIARMSKSGGITSRNSVKWTQHLQTMRQPHRRWHHHSQPRVLPEP